MFVLVYVFALIYNIFCMLFITMVIAALTLAERKVLSLCQRRVGPNFVGYRGRLQYIADALKMFIKGLIIPKEANKVWFVVMPAFAGLMCYSFWINSVWGPNISIFEIEYNIVYALLFSVLFGYTIMLCGFFSKSKFALLSGVRAGLLMLNLEVFLGLLFLNGLSLVGSFNFANFVVLQESIWFIWFFLGFLGLFLLVFLLETNRIPFDLAEAESELVSGYSVEYGGFFFALFYLGEYFHLFFFSMIFSLLFFGGWFLGGFFFFGHIFDFVFF